MKSITLFKLCPAAYESEDFYLEPSEGWQDEWRTFFAERLAEDSTITSRRIQLFIDSMDEIDDTTVTQKFWLMLLKFMSENDINTITSTKWETIYFLQENLPIKFKFSVGTTIYGHDDDPGISNAELEDMIANGVSNPLDTEFPDVQQKYWDLNLVISFSQEKVEDHDNYDSFPKNILKELDDVDEHSYKVSGRGNYSLDVFLLKQTSLKNIKNVLSQWNARIDEVLL